VRAQHLAVVGALAATLAGCASRQEETPRRPAPPVIASPLPAPPIPAARVYFNQSAYNDLFVARASEMALAKSRDARVRGLAEVLLRDHRGLAAQLSFAGRRLDLLPSAQIHPAARIPLSQLQAATGRQFDEAYLALMRSNHQHSVGVHRGFARGGESPTLRAVAKNAAEIEQRHLIAVSR